MKGRLLREVRDSVGDQFEGDPDLPVVLQRAADDEAFEVAVAVFVTIHSDSDSDRDDDYVDEYEWFVGGGVGSGYDGVTSTCVASWHDRPYTGVVANGCLVVEA